MKTNCLKRVGRPVAVAFAGWLLGPAAWCQAPPQPPQAALPAQPVMQAVTAGPAALTVEAAEKPGEMYAAGEPESIQI